jgi:hypothetical protein
MDNEHCYQGKERRAICTDVLVLRQRFEDQEAAREVWRAGVDKKLEIIMDFISKLRTPYNLGVWATRIFFGSIIVSIAVVIFRFGGKILRWLLGG